MDELVKIRRKDDPIRRNVDKGDHEEEMSPMAPPDAYAPPGEGQSVAYEDMHPLLQGFRDEHERCVAQLEAFESALGHLQEHGPDPRTNDALGRFFEFMESEVLPHMRREERVLFPLLARRLLESGEHSQGDPPTTGVDVLEAEHVQLIQLSAVVLNFFGLATRLGDPQARRFTLDTAIQHGRELVEVLRLHMFREDNIAFSLAHGMITSEELDALAAPPKAEG